MESIEEQGAEEKRESVGLQQSTTRRLKQIMPFNKCSTVSFVRVGACHMCKMKGKLVYQCYRGYQATSCQKKFCFDCLVLIYKDNILESIQKNDSWRCPYIRKICRCKNCCMTRKEIYSILEIDTNASVYSNLRSRSRKEEEEENEAEEESMRCLMREKFKKLMDFNGQLINKVNTNYHKLTEEQIKFYNKLIHSNLSVVNNVGKSMIVHQTLLEE